jgi:hypothetical protein
VLTFVLHFLATPRHQTLYLVTCCSIFKQWLTSLRILEPRLSTFKLFFSLSLSLSLSLLVTSSKFFCQFPPLYLWKEVFPFLSVFPNKCSFSQSHVCLKVGSQNQGIKTFPSHFFFCSRQICIQVGKKLLAVAFFLSFLAIAMRQKYNVQKAKWKNEKLTYFRFIQWINLT